MRPCTCTWGSCIRNLGLLVLLMPALVNSASVDLADLEDPTRPKVSNLTEEADLYSIQSIIIAPNRRLAIINGITVGVGSELNGARVIAIHKNPVILLRSGQRKTLYLFGRRIWTLH